jgi:hypothetical protein
MQPFSAGAPPAKRIGDLKGAHEDYNKAFDLNPNYAKTFYAG